MNNKIITVAIVGIIILAGVTIGLSTFGNNNEPVGDKITVKDFADRDVTVNYPVDKIAVLDVYSLDSIILLLGDNWVNSVVLLPNNVVKSPVGKYDSLAKAYPEIKNIETVPDLYASQAMPEEEILKSGADVVIGCKSEVEMFGDDFKTLTSAGVGVYLTGFYDDPYTDFGKSMNGLGKMVGLEDRAKSISEDFNKEVNRITSILPDGLTDKTFYLEITESDFSKPGMTTTMGTPECQKLGLTNVYKGMYEYWTYEQLAAANPDVIYIAINGYYNPNAIKGIMGYGSEYNLEKLTELQNKILDRPGWSELNAVKNGNVIFYDAEFGFSVSALVKFQSLAHYLYPAEVGDINPLENLKSFYEKYGAKHDLNGVYFFEMV